MRRQIRFPLMAEINITPLTDVILVLLIILMASSSFILSESTLPLNLPRADGKHGVDRRGLFILDVDQNGTLFADGVPTSPQALKRKLELMNKASRFPTPVLLRVDAAARHQSFVAALEVLSKAGCENISLSTRTQERKNP